jgi:hypothetical protein
MIDTKSISDLVGQELSLITDGALLECIRKLLVAPYPVERDWDYGSPGERFVCWTLLEHRPSNTGIAYCSEGFGPRNPWGLVFLTGPHMGIGMDSGWFARLEDAVRESRAWEGPNPHGYESSVRRTTPVTLRVSLAALLVNAEIIAAGPEILALHQRALVRIYSRHHLML